MNLAEERAVFLLALQFLTRLPVDTEGVYSPARMARTPRWYPGAGAAIGLAAGVVWWLAAAVLPAPVAALLAVAAGVLLTGAMHEDGLADTCDGLGGGRTREHALEIMRDSRIGSYGAAALVLSLALRATALSALAAGGVAALVGAHAVGRAAPVLSLARSRYARAEGAGAPVSGGLARGDVTFALASAGVAALPALFVFGLWATVAALAVAWLGAEFVRAWGERRIGGYTGDTLGAGEQAAEIGFLIGLLVWL